MMITMTRRTWIVLPDSMGSETVPSAPSNHSITRITAMVQSINPPSPVLTGVLIVAARGEGETGSIRKKEPQGRRAAIR
jgi:hypothetical protein